MKSRLLLHSAYFVTIMLKVRNGWVQETYYEKVVPMVFCRLGTERHTSRFWHPWIFKNESEVGHRRGFLRKKHQMREDKLGAFLFKKVYGAQRGKNRGFHFVKKSL